MSGDSSQPDLQPRPWASRSVASVALSSPAGAAPLEFLSHFSTVTQIASTVPVNGDLNPYGIANVPFSAGDLVRGTRSSATSTRSNLQATGSTIEEVSPVGAVTQFAELDAAALPRACPGGVGLTTSLAVLNDGYVVVGSLPVTQAGTGTPEAGLPDCAQQLRGAGRDVGREPASTDPGT